MYFDSSLLWDGDQSHAIRSITVVISTVQCFGILVGSIAPIIRCIATATYFNPTISSSIKRINMFRIETHWTQKLQQWKDIYITSYIPGRHCKIVFNCVKNMILNIFMALQIILVVISKTICLIPSCVMLPIFSCCHYCNSLLISQKKVSGASNHDDRPEIEGYRGCVLRIEEEAELTDRRLRNMLKSIKKFSKKNLMKLLRKSSVLSGVVLDFHNNQALPFCKEETHNCWSLVAVTLTTIAISLPNIPEGHVTELLACMREGLKFVRHIEETLYAKDELVGARKTARRIWIEAEVYRKWLEIKLQNPARKGEPSRNILEWLTKEAVKIENNKKINADDSRVIAAMSMHKISETIRCKNENNWPTDMELFDWISTVIADLLWACLTNLPRVIALNCHHDAIEKRGDNIRSAARLLGNPNRF
ncbi:hypothetical protein OSB04_013934 [Centaurea solstitialis]|uniref:Uncharacterized protein n=1 Tax=Centaurea solstitialis TaxID=347529 RepID=A0AA38TE71_9ASTR|nr:hypothetical protein OSB04_013934 [Centaurea solstitialis]